MVEIVRLIEQKEVGEAQKEEDRAQTIPDAQRDSTSKMASSKFIFIPTVKRLGPDS